MPVKVAVITRGCDKNTVDSESMLGLLQANGYELVDEPYQADALIVNTCGFIAAAKEESINTILEAAQLKKIKPELKIIAAGCMVQKYCQELAAEIPEIDGFLGSNNVPGLLTLLDKVLSGDRVTRLENGVVDPDLYIPRISTTPHFYSYLKIAEGCDNRCSYCAIPVMRGDYSSRSIPVLLKEAAFLVEKGVKEISLVAQDITLYGKDLYGRESLTKLLQELVKIEGLEWVRLLYCYPTHISDELIDLIARERKICKYLDIPLQHADQEILNKMGRKQKTEKVVELIQKLRKKIPDLALRTTFIVGFPGEREQHFATLLKFMKEVEFDWAGVFTYSPEEGTPAAEFPEQVPEEIKEERYHRAMLLQREITSRRNVRWLGQSLTVLIEKAAREQGKGIYQGRTQHQAPEVDGVVFFKGCDLNPGEFVPVSVTGVEDYDLLGESKA